MQHCRLQVVFIDNFQLTTSDIFIIFISKIIFKAGKFKSFLIYLQSVT